MPQDLWKLAEEKLNEPKKKIDNDESETSREESTVILVGSKECGKTSMVLRFLDRDEPTRPTIALEYTFGRRNRDNVKEVGHIWELGGGPLLMNLFDIPANERSISSLSVIILVDLSKPEELWNTIETCLIRITQSIDQICQEDPYTAKTLKESAWKRFGEEHGDRQLISPCLVPLAIVGCKYDIFQDMDSEQKKMIAKTLRFLAHTNAASLTFFSSRIEMLVTKGRALMSQLVFGTSGSKQIITDASKPISIPFGADNFSDIGAPPKLGDGPAPVSANSPVQLWKNAFTSAFTQKDLKNVNMEDPSKDPQYAEKAIDLIREQKDQELEKLVRQQNLEDKQAQQLLQQQRAENNAKKAQLARAREQRRQSVEQDSKSTNQKSAPKERENISAHSRTEQDTKSPRSPSHKKKSPSVMESISPRKPSSRRETETSEVSNSGRADKVKTDVISKKSLSPRKPSPSPRKGERKGEIKEEE